MWICASVDFPIQTGMKWTDFPSFSVIVIVFLFSTGGRSMQRINEHLVFIKFFILLFDNTIEIIEMRWVQAHSMQLM